MELNDIQKEFIKNKLNSLKTSKFRNSFHLRKYMYEYIDKNGLDKVEEHCIDFINTRLSVYNEEKDGKQTPTKGHPVFIAQHATACCCRGCLLKWHKIPKERELTDKEKNFIKALIMTWIEEEYRNR